MNERIREFAEQAGSTHKQSLGVYQFYSDELEKFVWLIVQDCADFVRESYDQAGVGSGYENVGLKIYPAQKAKSPDEPTEAVAPTGNPQST